MRARLFDQCVLCSFLMVQKATVNADTLCGRKNITFGDQTVA